MNKLVIIFALFILMGCISSTPHLKELARTAQISETRLEQIYPLKGFSSGGELSHNIKSINRSYTIQCGEISIDEARRMIVTCVEEFYHTINRDYAIQPFLNERPFQRGDFCLGIIFHNQANYPFTEGLARAGAARNSIRYCTYSEKLGFSLISQEPYEVAYEKVYGHKICD